MADKNILKIPVEISDEDWKLIKKSRSPLREYVDDLKQLSQKGLAVDKNELFVWCIFKDWAEEPEWDNYRSIRSHLPDYSGRFEKFFDFSNEQVKYKRQPTRDITEFMGVGASLKLATVIFNCASNDFRMIPENQKSRFDGRRIKVLDYENEIIGSDGQQVLEIESKGTQDTASTKKQICSIRDKKSDQYKERPDRIRFGSVLDIQYNSLEPTKLYFIDPPSSDNFEDPQSVRLLNRLHYYRRWLRRITDGSLALALSNRINILESLDDKDWTKLDGTPLVSRRLKPIEIYDQMAESVMLSPYDMIHGRTIDLRVTADVIRKTRSINYGNRDRFMIPDFLLDTKPDLFFYGLHKNVLRTLVEQDFDQIKTMKYSFKEVPEDSKTFIKEKTTIWQSGLVTGSINVPEWNETRLSELLKKLIRGAG